MADYTTIWEFVERQLKVPIPPYIKKVLMCCGFDNCYTIASIEEKDLEYLQGEIRKGNLTRFSRDKTSEGFSLEKILEGSKSVEEFEFCRGHQKLIISIAKLVKENLDKNGIDGFGLTKQYVETPKKKASLNGNLSDVPFKRQKNSQAKLEIDYRASEAPNEINDGEIAIHRSKLIEQAVASLKNDTPAMFKENFAIIQAAITSDLVTVNRKKKGLGYSAKIKCPYCKGNINVFHILSGAKLGTWNSSNFGRHLELVHLKIPKTKMSKKKAKKNIDEIIDSDSDEKIAADDNFVALAVGSIINMKDVVPTTFSGTVFQSIVNYSDTDESGNEDHIIIEIPSKLDPVIIESTIDGGVGINSETFNLTSNEPLESLEAISIQYPDSLYQSDLSNGVEEDFGEAEIDSIGAANIEEVPIFRNGHKTTSISPNIYTVNTCAFDSVFLIYACSYFDNQNYRKDLELFVGQSQFTGLIKKYFDNFQSKAHLRDLYDDRNLILKEIFSCSYYKKSDNMIRNSKYIFINCTTGVGGMFGQICTRFGENIASAIELKICSKCETTAGKILPFFTIDYNNVDLRDIQKSISSGLTQDRMCITCKSPCVIHKILNDILVLEVEPIIKIELQKTISIQNVTVTITIANKYELLAVVEFDPTQSHFLSHVKRKNNVWKTYDDLTSSETDTDLTKEIYPYLLFYKQKTYHLADYNDFKTTLLSFFHNNTLCQPLVRKILPSEKRKATHHSKYSVHASYTTTSAEWNKKLEMGWKY